MASSRKAEGREAEEEEEKEEGEVQKKEMVEEWKRAIISLSMMKLKKGREEKESKMSEIRTKARQTLGKFGMNMQEEVQIKESRWTEATPKRWKQPKGEDRMEMKKEC